MSLRWALRKGKRKNSPALAQDILFITRMDANALPLKSQNRRTCPPPAHIKHREMSQGTGDTNESLPNARIHAICFQEKGNGEDKTKMVEASPSGCSTLLTAQQFLHFNQRLHITEAFLRHETDNYRKHECLLFHRVQPSGSPSFLSFLFLPCLLF